MNTNAYKVFLSICLIISISSVAGISAPPAGEKEQQVIGHVIQIQGNVFARHNGVERQLQLKSPIFLNDRIFTREKSRLQILLDDDSVISQGEKGEIVLDEYTYKPKERDKTSCSLRLIKGFFRVITGKITDLSPERFTVRSNMATIGIRGCDLGFDIKDGVEDVYIFYLPANRSVFMQSIAGAMLLKEYGVAILVTKEERPSKRRFSAMERLNFIKKIIPDSGQLNGGVGSGMSKTDSDTGGGGRLVHDVLTSADEDQKNQDANNTLDILEQTVTQVVEPSSSGSGQHVSLREILLKGGESTLNDWEWALWSDKTVTYGANQKAGASFLTQAEFVNIANGIQSYQLAGQGFAGAILYSSRGYKQTVNGICQIQVTIGGVESIPSWNGVFNMRSGNNALSFNVENGKFDMNSGHLILSVPHQLSLYTMTVNDVTYSANTLSSASLEGQLIKPGLGSQPISAVSGKFAFQHGGNAGAHGAFGADLKNRMSTPP